LFGPEIADTTFNGYRVSTELSGYILQNILFCVQQKKKKLIQLWNNLRSKWWQNFYFWVELSI